MRVAGGAATWAGASLDLSPTPCASRPRAGATLFGNDAATFRDHLSPRRAGRVAPQSELCIHTLAQSAAPLRRLIDQQAEQFTPLPFDDSLPICRENPDHRIPGNEQQLPPLAPMTAHVDNEERTRRK